jgi:hypothetical protein
MYNRSKKYIGSGVVVLGTTSMKMALYMSTSNASTVTLSTKSQLTNESSGGGYPAGGKALGNMKWSSIISAGSWSFDSTDIVFTANGSTLSNVKFAVVYDSRSAAGKLLCWSKLCASKFDITSPNTLTVQFHSNGLFELH